MGRKTAIPLVDTASHSVETPPHRRLITEWLRIMEPVAPADNRVPSPDQISILTSTTPTTRGRKRTPSVRVYTAPQDMETSTLLDYLLFMASWGSWSQRAARVAPRDNVKIPPHPETIRSHPRIRNPSTHTQTPTTPRRKRTSLGSIPHRKVWKTQLHWLIYDGLAGAHGRCPASPGGCQARCPNQKYFGAYTPPTTRRQKRISLGSTPSRTVVLTNPVSGVRHSTIRLLLTYQVLTYYRATQG